MASRMGIGAAGAIVYYVARQRGLADGPHRRALPGGDRGGEGVARALREGAPSGAGGGLRLPILPRLASRADPGATAQLGLPAATTGFVLPLAVSIFKVHAPVNWSGLAVFTALLYGIPLGPEALLTVVVAARC